MKINWRSISVTTGLLAVLGIVAIVEISLFISGPARSYEQQIAKQEALVESKYKGIKNLNRHVFYYTTYVGEDDKRFVWFNVKGKTIITKKKSTLQLEEAKQIAQEKYGAKDIQVTLGYGYKNPVYVIESDAGYILLDYDTLKQIYFLKEGDA